MYEAPWADEVKSDKSYDYSYDWHFQNLKDSMTRWSEGPARKSDKRRRAFVLCDKNNDWAVEIKSVGCRSIEIPRPSCWWLASANAYGPFRRQGEETGWKWIGLERKLMFMLFGTVKLRQKQIHVLFEFSSYLQNKFRPKENSLKTVVFYSRWKWFYAVRNSIYTYDMKNTNNYHYVYRFADDLDGCCSGWNAVGQRA